MVIYKVGDDFTSIANAARRFLDQQDQMDHRVHNVFAGHLRAIVGNMTVEEMIRDREKLTQLTRESSGIEMEKLGLIVDSLQVQEIEDPTGYIANLGAPARRGGRQPGPHRPGRGRPRGHRAGAGGRRPQGRGPAGQPGQAGRLPGRDRRRRRQGQQAGPLSEAPARQEVVVEETKAAELEAEREEQRLQATVRKPADAKAYEQVTLAKAERDARVAQAEAQRQEVELHAAGHAQQVKLAAGAEAERVRLAAGGRGRARPARRRGPSRRRPAIGEAEAAATQAKGLAEGEAVRAKGMAEAEAIKARADALAENQDAVIGQQLAENWPAIVEAAAKPFGDVDQMIVLNGAQGLSDMLAQALSQGVTGLQMARNLLGKGHNGASGNGHGTTDNGDKPVPAAAGTRSDNNNG